MPIFAPTVTLNNGHKMPVLGLGTWLSREGEGIEAIKAAIDAGYRHIDTAYLYRNEKEVGQAIREKIAEGVIKREDIFVTTKLWNNFFEPCKVAEAFKRSFENLDIGYIDLYLMHSPMSFKFDGWELGHVDATTKPEYADVDIVDTWRAMEELLNTGKVRSIGVSNFNSEQIARILQQCEMKPVTNQVECNPGINQRKLIEFCRKLDIVVTAYSPLGRPNYYEMDPVKVPKPALDDPRVKAIAEKYNKTPGQVILRYLVEIGTVPVPKSSNPVRLRQNIDIFDFQLTKEEIETMDGLNTGKRTVPFHVWISHKNYPFHIEF
ncbi:aldo-keto reductase family 1 member B1-like [Toxorhynchites rutilus septentrionalis]|uniref:aldo-keto reductase family 1 member B1-like n=1 Tax=Toxorhynchites rutilus septentrionalis TaxID=329112 RepID=UPI00247AF940|nr:aldo-keto reductase family 1 member B1-like [Toxorhynchites rutilus septentrionalis]